MDCVDTKIYGPDEYARYVAATTQNIKFAPAPSVVHVPGATVWPLGKPYEHGVYDGAGQFVAASNIVFDHVQTSVTHVTLRTNMLTTMFCSWGIYIIILGMCCWNV